jgi:catechol 2,3-dioxygenase-like lactoylglutathione lyase family enzyme
MIDHLGISVSDLDRAKRFYAKALAPLDIQLLHEITPEQSGSGAYLAFGEGENPYFWLGMSADPGGHAHVAFEAKSRDVVDQFYKAALAAGGKDNGAPGLRPQYHANYYGAFVLDPDGNNIEAVCHSPA